MHVSGEESLKKQLLTKLKCQSDVCKSQNVSESVCMCFFCEWHFANVIALCCMCVCVFMCVCLCQVYTYNLLNTQHKNSLANCKALTTISMLLLLFFFFAVRQ